MSIGCQYNQETKASANQLKSHAYYSTTRACVLENNRLMVILPKLKRWVDLETISVLRQVHKRTTAYRAWQAVSRFCTLLEAHGRCLSKMSSLQIFRKIHTVIADDIADATTAIQ